MFREILRFILQGGPFIHLQATLALVVVALVVINTVRLMLRRGPRAAGLERSIDAVLFWGCLIAIMGFLGQWRGLYRGANAIVDYGVVDPRLVVLGLGESLNTAVVGMFALIVAAFLWFVLRLAQHSRVSA